MGGFVTRREFITLLGGASIAWPLAARAQQPAMPVIGYLTIGAPEPSAHLVAAFRKGLSEAGYVEGQNVAIEFRWARYDKARLPEMAADLVRRRVAVIVTPADTSAALAAKALTTTIPIVFMTGSDPTQVGLVASLSRPGGNVTGVAGMAGELEAKRLGLLHELLPGAERFVLLVNLKNPLTARVIKATQGAAASLGRQVEVYNASSNPDIETVFEGLRTKRPDAVLVGPDVLFMNQRVRVATLTTQYKFPAICPFREDAQAGCLMSYGASITDNTRQVGVYAARILKGEKPADMPVLQPTKFDFIINLKTAKALGLNVPPSYLARADEVIE
jgi:putative ABC transport system substrate-binding protein